MRGYPRVLPRDLFNEANLLKCVGRLWIALDEAKGHRAAIVEESVPEFSIVQDPSSGAIEISNVTFVIGDVRHRLIRPLNSRAEWPLWVEAMDPESDFEPVEVFDGDGTLSEAFLALIGAT